MYKRHFEDVANFLKSKGIDCRIYRGRSLSDKELSDVAKQLKMQLPRDLLMYFRELGDGFRIQWELPKEGNLVSFGLSFISDIKDECAWIHHQIRESGDMTEEAERRLKWLPIKGIGEGGCEFCLDTSRDPAPVTYFESSWRQNPGVWRSSLASSLRLLVCKWSRYCFSDPLADGRPIDMTILAETLDDEFDWNPSHFDPSFDRGEVSFRSECDVL